jgi:hypothetical protein
MRRRSLAERDLPRLAGLGIEYAKRALPLRGVPDGAVGRGRDIMDPRALRKLEQLRIGRFGLVGGAGWSGKQGRERGDHPEKAHGHSSVAIAAIWASPRRPARRRIGNRMASISIE